MKREIKFRGKRTANGEWVVGQLLIGFTGATFIVTSYDHILGMCEQFEVDDKTVGQFTGLLDKNGKDAYFKDIVKATLRDIDGNYRGEYVGTIEWGEFEIELHTTDHIFPVASWRCVESFEIIGNIHEHPELLK